MQTLEKRLDEEGLLGKVPEEIEKVEESSLFILVFYAISGVLSAVLILIVLLFTLQGIFNSVVAVMITGLLLLGLAYVMLHKSNSDFMEYFALIFAFAGEAFLLFGLGELLHLERGTAIFGLLIVFTVLFFLFDSTLHRFMSAFIVLYSIFYFAMMYNFLFLYSSILVLLMVWLWLNEYAFVKYFKEQQVFGYALTIFVLFISSGISNFVIYEFNFTAMPDIDKHMYVPGIIYTMVHFATVIGAVVMILLKLGLRMQEKVFIFTLVATALFYYVEPIGLSLFEPLFAVLIGYLVHNKILLVLGVLAMIVSIFSYYYLMFIDFTMKSQLLLIFGVVVLVLVFILHRYIVKQEGKHHA